MKIADLLQCAKPLIFENKDDEYTYSLHGTCFVVRFHNAFYGITAKHCLRNRDRDSIRIRLLPGDLQFQPMRQIHTIDGDDDFHDLAFLELATPLIGHAKFQPPLVLDLDASAKLKFEITSETVLAMVGFPSEINAVDYEKRILKTKGFSADGRYAGPSEDPHCSKIRFNNVAQIQDLDGLSGSPVFAFKEISDGAYLIDFAGVLVRATKTSGTGRYVNSWIIIRALQILAANR